MGNVELKLTLRRIQIHAYGQQCTYTIYLLITYFLLLSTSTIIKPSSIALTFSNILYSYPNFFVSRMAIKAKLFPPLLGRSYVVGWGRNPPKQPHHAASSCPDRPAVCGWPEFDKDAPNPQILYGALVSGPDEADKFHDHREDYVYTEVTLDYNAGFTSALAGLLQLRVKSTT